MEFSTFTRRSSRISKYFISWSLIHLIFIFRPLLGNPGCCKFTLTCSRYSQYVLLHKPLLQAFVLIGKRLIKCSPFFK